MRKKKLLSLVLTVALVLGCVTIPTSGVFATESGTAINLTEGKTVDVPQTDRPDRVSYKFVAQKEGFYRIYIPETTENFDVYGGVFLNNSIEAEYSVWSENKLDYTAQLKVGDEIIISVSCPAAKLTVSKVQTITGKDGQIKWSLNLDSGKLKITGTGLLTGDEWSGNSKWIKSVEISKGITTIGKYAFKNNTGLKTIKFPSSVTTIAYGAFDHCKSLQKVTLPSSLKKIETGAFIFCRSLSKVEVKKGANNTKLESIGMKAFGGCTKLKSLTIPKRVNSIGKAAYGYDLTEDHALKESKVKDAAIYGIKGTKAQSYAKANKILFKSVKNTGASVLTAPKLTGYIGKMNGKKSHTLKFTKVDGATGYQIYFSFSGNTNTWRKLQSFKSYPKEFTLAWDSGIKCYYKVRAYRKAGSKYTYGPFSAVKLLK